LTAARVAEEARRIGFDGAITLVGTESHPPYDRPPLSKEYLTADVEPPLSLHIDTDTLDVELMTDTTALALDTRNRRVRTSRGDVPYDALVIATGSEPKQVDLGPDLVGVTTLRNADDARSIRAALVPGAKVVVVGAGFIGGEVASSARARGADVTMVEERPLPLAHAVGPLVAERLAILHQQYGVNLRTRVRVRSVEGPGRVERVLLTDGSAIDADLVVVGIGVTPATRWLRGSGVAVSDGVACSPYLESTVPGVYAAGDVARWVNAWDGRSTRLEHWTAAGEQAAIAARNALTDQRVACSIVPYFWSDWYGHKLQLLGEATDEVELTVDGGATDPFLARYRFDGQLVGGFALDRTGSLMRQRREITARSSWEAMLRDQGAAGDTQRTAVPATSGPGGMESH
jgi:NADPH-dependent 2,4-dienoyl-CoA reductase/sulfur reductase-like enzyme